MKRTIILDVAAVLIVLAGLAYAITSCFATRDPGIIEVYATEDGSVEMDVNTVTNEVRFFIEEVSVPAICENDSTSLDMRFELAGVPKDFVQDGQVLKILMETDGQTYQKMAIFTEQPDEPGVYIVKLGACLNVPCVPNCVEGVFILRKVQEQ